MVWLTSFFALFFISVANAAIGPSASLNIVNKVVAPDGFKRSAVLVDGQVSAPLIKGDRFFLNVVNSLKNDTMERSTSIHWHGFFQKGTNYADGPVGVSQCPISPGHSFLYDFAVPDQAGTFWYHSHFATQYCDGLRGPFVVYDPFDPHKHLYDVDDESTIITLGEWYHLPSPSVIRIPLADSTLINGIGRYTGGPKVDLAVVNVVPGKRYRFRLISIACDPNYVFSIDGHQLTVIEVDGENTHPLTVDSINIFVGQRYSFILHADKPIDNYWIRALPNSGKGDLPNGFNGGINSAILRYKGAPRAEPRSLQTTNGKSLRESEIRPLDNARAPGKPYPGGADVNINLDLSFDSDTRRFAINGRSYKPPAIPVLLQILSGAQTAHDLLPQGSIYTLPRNKVIEVTIPGGVIGGPHPFHLHGHTFAVVKSAGEDSQVNYINPVRRDVVNIGDFGSNVTIRFTTDNPGPWFLHCHIDWHLDIGLAVVFAEDPRHTKIVNKPSGAWKQLCPIFDGLPPSQTSIHTISAN